MLVPCFHFYLNNSILLGQAVVGRYDGRHPSLTCATSAGKVFIHNAHRHSAAVPENEREESEIRFLNINQQLTALATNVCSTDPGDKHEFLLVGTPANLLAYSVQDNRDVFYKDVPEGVNALIVSPLGTGTVPMAVVGGNCTIQGFDPSGEECYWTVTGDSVTAMAVCDLASDGSRSLLVASDDFEIRVFNGEEVVQEMAESEPVTQLCALRPGRFAYGLRSGTLGLYDKSTRLWRHKIKSSVSAMRAFDIDGDGVAELVCGWSNGKLEVCSERSGDVIFKEQFNSGVASLLVSDYRLDSSSTLMCCTADGEVRGYLPAPPDSSGNLMDRNVEEEALQELNQRKQDLLMELKSYEDSARDLNGHHAPAESNGADQRPGGGSELSVRGELEVVIETRCLELVVSSTGAGSQPIRAVIVSAEHLFEQPSLLLHPKVPSQEVRVPLCPQKNIAVDLKLKVLVAPPFSTACQVFEFVQRLPKFSLFLPLNKASDASAYSEPQSSVVFTVPDRASRVALWLNKSFVIEQSLDSASLDVSFISLRQSAGSLRLIMEDSGKVTVRTDDMEVAGDIVQDLCAFLQIEELESMADFAPQMEHFFDLLGKVKEYNTVRLKLTAEMADSSNLIKTLVVKAEDARLLNDMKQTRQMYTKLFEVNGELFGEYKKRETNYSGLLECLKDVNLMIQKASNLRVGKAKARIVTECRAAIKANNVQSLFKIIKLGRAS